MLSIAHRLDTIIDFDRILVMDRGQIAEFGSPKQLIEQKGSFYDLVMKTDDSQRLIAMAK